MKLASIASALLVLLALSAAAQTVTYNGHIGTQKALLVIDGEPHTVTLGTTVRGVRLLSLTDAQAEIEVDATRRTLALGAGAVRANVNGAGRFSSGSAIVLTAGTNGHFRTTGQINGKAIEFMVDTGASSVVISQADADRLGLDYKNAPTGMASTANGVAPFRLITLNAVRIGDVEVANVEAAVIPAPMRGALLGNSFLMRFQMKRENDVMRLEKRN
jgi:aspartyl protease family protein